MQKLIKFHFEISDSSKELVETFDRLQNELDSMRKQVYDMYRNPIRVSALSRGFLLYIFHYVSGTNINSAVNICAVCSHRLSKCDVMTVFDFPIIVAYCKKQNCALMLCKSFKK